MDTPRQDDMDLSFDPLDIVENVLSAENLPFDRTEDGDLAFSITGQWKDYPLWFAWRPEGDCLQLCCSLDLKVTQDHYKDLIELISLINPRVWVGHFELWIEESEILFRHAMALPGGERPSLSQAASMIDAAMEAADRFYPAFDFLLRGAKSAQEAMAACMFDTVGEA